MSKFCVTVYELPMDNGGAVAYQRTPHEQLSPGGNPLE